MQKLKLKDGQIIEIMDGAKENYYQVSLASINDFAPLYSKLTDYNLSEIELYTSDDVLSAVYSDKSVSKIYPTSSGTEVIAVIELKPADTVGKNIKDLQITQDIQNNAILDLATMIMGGM